MSTKTKSNTETNAELDHIIDPNSHISNEYLNTIDDNSAPSYSIALEGMVIPNYTRNLHMMFAMLSKSGNINFYMLTPLRLHNPQAQRGFEDRNFYLATNMNSNKDTTNTTGKIVYRNSNFAMLKHLLTPKIGNSNNPFNAMLIMDSYVRTGIIPSRITLTNEEIMAINMPALTLKKNIEEIKAQNIDDVETAKELYTQGYSLYKKQMKELVASGLLTTSQIIMAEPNSLKPILTLDSSTSAGTNEFLNVKNILNGKSEMTWMPMLNKVFGGFNLTNEDSIQGSDIKLGKIELSSGLYANSKKATANKYKENVDIVVSVRDNKRLQGKTTKSRSESLEEAAQRQVTIFSTGTLSPFVARAGEGGKTNGINQFTVELDQYYQHSSPNQTNSLEFDSLGDIGSTSTDDVSVTESKVSLLDELFDTSSNTTDSAKENKAPASTDINEII